MSEKKKDCVFPTAEEDAGVAELACANPQARSSSYRLAYADKEFLLRDELRPVRLQLELLKPEISLKEHDIEATVVVFGSTRIPEPEQAEKEYRKAETAYKKNPSDKALKKKFTIAKSIAGKAEFYDEARKLGQLITRFSNDKESEKLVVVTGGGPGIMEAANRGADDEQGKSIGLNIVLPFEQCPNKYITPELSFQFHYFAIRKLHFLLRARALVAFPGGFGTLDELFETLTLIQTKKVKPIPVLLFGEKYWKRIIDFEALSEEGTIGERDVELFEYVETAEQAWDKIREHYQY